MDLFAVAHLLNVAGGLSPQDARLLEASENALNRVSRDSNPAVASQADGLLAVLLFMDARSRSSLNAAEYASAAAAMENAIKADRNNAWAETDLELLLRQEEADFVRHRQPGNQGSNHGHTIGRGKGTPPIKASEGDY
jgi:hypothetical protein